MAFQFAHIQTYSRKGNNTNRSVADICAEAGRVPGHHPHVAEALVPTLIAGDFLPEEVPEEIERRIAEAKAKLKGKTKATKKVITVATHVLEAQVYSHPVYVRPAPEEHEGEDRPCLNNPADREAYDSWRNATVEFVYREADRRGLDVLCIVEHLDEAHPHIHALSVPKNLQINAKHSHPGHVAAQLAIEDAKHRNLPAEEMKAAAKDVVPAARAGRKGGDSAKPLGRGAAGSAKRRNRKATELTEGKILQKIGNRAYSAAMRAWQDLYYEEVGIDAGLLRLGPQRFRWSRDEYMQRKQDAQVLAEARRVARVAEQRREVAEEKVRRSEESIGPGSKFREKMEQIARDAVDQLDAAESKMAGLQPEIEAAQGTITAADEAAGRIEKQRAEEEALKERVTALQAQADDLAAKNAESERLLASAADARRELEEIKEKTATAKAEEVEARANQAAAIAEIDRRISEVKTRETAADADRKRLNEQEASANRRLREVEAKEAGLNAWRDGDLGIREGNFVTKHGKEELRDRLKPVRDWLMAVVGPIEEKVEAEVSKRVQSYKEELKTSLLRAVDAITSAWAAGMLRQDEQGGMFLKGSREDKNVFHKAVAAWRGLTGTLFSRLPSLEKVAQAEKDADRLSTVLTQAEERDARNRLAAFQKARDGGFRSGK